jgi:ferritin-like protein
MVVGRPLISKKEVEALYRKGEETFFNNFYELYKKTDEIDKKEVMIKNLKGKKVDWLVSKYMVMELFTAIKGREQQVLDLLVRIAKSETKDSAPFLKVM